MEKSDYSEKGHINEMYGGVYLSDYLNLPTTLVVDYTVLFA